MLIITDLTPNRNGFAAPQTLHNLLQLLDYDYLILAHHSHLRNYGVDVVYKNVIVFKDAFSWQWNNRFDKYIHGFRIWVNALLVLPNRQLLKQVNAFAPDEIIIVPNSMNCIRFGDLFSRLLQRQPFAYFMDDYQYYLNPKLRQTVQHLISNCKGLLFIGKQLKSVFFSAYSIDSRRLFFLAHNPVDIRRVFPIAQAWQQGDILRIVYAGSVYPNHKDSLLLLVGVISKLQVLGIQVILTIYTQPAFWKLVADELTPKVKACIHYGGLLKYDDLHAALNTHHIGLVTESHLPELRAMASSSLQTKVNDYFLAGLPVWCVGPSYGACSIFLKEQDIGCAFSEFGENELLQQLFNAIDADSITRIQKKAREYLLTNNDTAIYRNSLTRFFNEA